MKFFRDLLTFSICFSLSQLMFFFSQLFQVRVPMVCQYAHKLAYLVGESVHKQPAESLETLLYYL